MHAACNTSYTAADTLKTKPMQVYYTHACMHDRASFAIMHAYYHANKKLLYQHAGCAPCHEIWADIKMPRICIFPSIAPYTTHIHACIYSYVHAV